MTICKMKRKNLFWSQIFLIMYTVESYTNDNKLGKCLDEHRDRVYLIFFERSYIDCVKECKRRPNRCRSFNYDSIVKICVLLDRKLKSTGLRNNCVRGNIDEPEFDQIKLHGGCETFRHKCTARKEMCSLDTETGQPFCEISDCGHPSRYFIDLEHYTDSSIGSSIVVKCKQYFYQSQHGIGKCQTDGRWDFGIRCRAPKDCKEIQERYNLSDGIYYIQPPNISKNVRVHCDMSTNGGGWTVFQRRIDGEGDFNQTWEAYMNGFRSTSSTYWLGNTYLHALTQTQSEFCIRKGKDGSVKTLQYDNFLVEGEMEKYRLTLGNLVHKDGATQLPTTHRTKENGMKFSTVDQDNDRSNNKNCAVVYSMGWWFDKCDTSTIPSVYEWWSSNVGTELFLLLLIKDKTCGTTTLMLRRKT